LVAFYSKNKKKHKQDHKTDNFIDILILKII